MPADYLPGIVLDTHALLWWQAASDRLSDVARHRIEQAAMRWVSPISFWELTMLVGKGRIELDRSTAIWINDFLATERVGVAELTPSVAVMAGELDAFHGDPADRLIVASAMASGLALVTKDAKIDEWARATHAVATVW